MKPHISVIVPFWNSERYLDDAIRSVFLQTFGDWELLLVDDGSTDCSSGIARQYAAANSDRIKYLTHPGQAHRGTAASRNLGLRSAKADIIAMLDSDDVWLPKKLETQLSALSANPAVDVVWGRPLYWDCRSGDSTLTDTIPELLAEPGLYEPPLLLRRFIQEGHSPCPSDMVVRKAALFSVGGFEESFTDGRSMFEDAALIAKLCIHCNVLVADETWTKYRIHSDSVCARQHEIGMHDSNVSFYLAWLDRYLESEGHGSALLRIRLKMLRVRYAFPRVARLLLPAITALRTATKWCATRRARSTTA